MAIKKTPLPTFPLQWSDLTRLARHNRTIRCELSTHQNIPSIKDTKYPPLLPISVFKRVSVGASLHMRPSHDVDQKETALPPRSGYNHTRQDPVYQECPAPKSQEVGVNQLSGMLVRSW